MRFSIKSCLNSSLAVSALLAAGPALAQTEEAAGEAVQEGGLEEIVVTARRVAENLQQVPISVGALSSDALQSRGITSLTELKSAIANVTITKTGVSGGNIMSIRGLTGTTIPNVTADSNIGLYFDGVYLARSQGVGGDAADLERVEVMRGPQGTLSGRNSAAGAINFITASPTGELGVIAEGLVGNFGRYRGRLTINTPEVSGFSARLTYAHDQNHGTIPNRSAGKVHDYGPVFGKFTTAKRADATNSDVLLAKVRYKGISDLTLDYKFDFSDQREVFPGQSVVGFGTSSAGVSGANLYLTQPPGTIPLFRDRPDYVNLDMLAPNLVRSIGHLLTATWDVSDDITLKSISSYRTLKIRQQSETDRIALSTPVCVSCGTLKIDQKQWSQELQLTGNSGPIKYIGGLYYFKERAKGDSPFALNKSLVPVDGVILFTPADYLFGNREEVTNESYAAYGHLEYKIIPKLEVALGGRYTVDDRSSLDTRPQFPNPVPDVVDFKRFNYDAALTYSFTRDINVYTRYATGYQSGGIMKRAVFRPEDHKSIEFGTKAEFLDRKVRINAAYFSTKVKDLQRASTGPIGLIIENFTDVKVKGYEIEVLAAPIRGATLSANYGYNKLTSPFQDVPSTPQKTFAFSAQYDAPQFRNESYLSFRVDGDYRSKYYGIGMLTAAARTANPQFQLPAAVWAGYASQQAYIDDIIGSSLAGGYWMVNARVSLADLPFAGGRARITAYVRNITDVEGRNFTLNNGLFSTSYERPRTYGLEFGFEL